MNQPKCSYCGHKEFFKTEEGDIACSKCGLVVSKEEAQFQQMQAQQTQSEQNNHGNAQEQHQQPTEQHNQEIQQNPEHNQGQQSHQTQQPKHQTSQKIKSIEEIETKTVPAEEIRRVINENKESAMLTGIVHLGDLFGYPPTEFPKTDAGYLAVHVADYYDENHNLEKFTMSQLGHTIFFTIETINLRKTKPTPKEMQLLKGLSITIMAKIERGETV